MRALVIGGVGFGIIAAIGSYMYNNRKILEQIPRQEILRLIKNLREQMYESFLNISYLVKQNAKNFPPDVVRGMILEGENQFTSEIKEKQAKVFSDISKDNFEDNLKQYYSTDVEIQYHIKQYQEDFEKALLGVSPDLEQQTITFLTPEKILQIVEELLCQKIKRVSNLISSKATKQQLLAIFSNDEKQDKKNRKQKLKKLDLSFNQTLLIQIFEFTVSKYIKMNQNFASKFEELTKKYESEVRLMISLLE